MMALVLFGSPGSGKGTQAKMLHQKFGIPHISTGDMLREGIRQGSNLGTAVVAKMQSGQLVRDELVNLMVKERLSQADAAAGFILDGYPRTLDQACFLTKWLDEREVGEVVIHLAVDYNVIIARLTGRRQCPLCGTLYNVASHPPKVDGLCDNDGQKLIVRDDDQEAVIRGRLEAYRQQTEPVLEFYRERGRRVVEVDAGDDSPEAVFGRVCQALEADDH